MKTKFAAAALFAAMSFAGSTALFAQQPTQQPSPEAGQQPGPGMRGPRGPRDFKRGGMGAFRQLDLTDSQRQQLREISERFRESTRTQREQMRPFHEQLRQGGTLSTDDQAKLNELREQIRGLERQSHEEMLSVLTPEQKAKLDQLKEERKRDHPRFDRKRGMEGQQPQQPTQP
jgi:Spy/CpxP family protein refolding chaperone